MTEIRVIYFFIYYSSILVKPTLCFNMDFSNSTHQRFTMSAENISPTTSIENTGNITNPSPGILGGKDIINKYFEQEYRNGCLGLYKEQLWRCTEGSAYAFALVASVVTCLGLIGNFIVIFKIIFDKKLHSDIYVALACVMISDLLALVSYFVTGYITEVIVLFDANLGFNVAFSIFTTHLSALNIILVTVVRYRLQREDSTESMSRKIIACSVIFTLVSLILAAAFITPIFLQINSTNYVFTRDYQVLVNDFSNKNLYLRLYMTSFPLIAGLILHFMRLRYRKSFYYIKKRISIILSILITIFNLACLQEVVLIAVFLIWGNQLPQWLLELTTSSEFRIFRINPLPWIINFSIKPIFLLLITPPMRQLWKHCCCHY